MTRLENKKNNKEIYAFLLNNEKITSDLMDDVLQKLHEKQTNYPDAKIMLIESEDELGLIIDVVEKNEVIEDESVTYWFDDYS